MGDITHHHLSLESLDHVLLLSHRLVGSLDLLTAEFILIVLLISIETSALKLVNSKNNGYEIKNKDKVNIECGRYFSKATKLNSNTYLSVFEFLDTSFLTLHPLRLHCV